jgi:hypothetical protein
MADATTHLGLLYLLAAQAQKHVTHNEALRLLDGLVQLSVVDRELTVPPASLTDGDRYLVASGATGVWAGWDFNIAYFVDGAWMKLAPSEGWVAWVADEALLLLFSGGTWSDFGAVAGFITINGLATGAFEASFSNAAFTLQDDTDPTKQAEFQLSALTAGTTRAYTLPDISGALATLADIVQTFAGTTTFSGTFRHSGATGTFGAATGAAVYGLGTGATTNGNTKTVNVGTNGANGSTTAINVGPVAGTATCTVTFGSSVQAILAPSANVSVLHLRIGGATADASNRLSVNTPQVLFNNAGAGIQATLNKNAASDDAGFVFQTGWSTRALFGTLGGDDFLIKVSPDGGAFFTALELDRTSGKSRVHNTLELVSQGADPASPVNGQIWYNHNSHRFKGRADGRTVTIGDDEIPSMDANAGRYVRAGTGVGAATVTVAGVANRMNIYPFIPKFDFTADRLGVNVATAVAGALGKIVVYEADEQGRPAGRITETGLDFSAVGAKEATVAVSFKKGKQYWIGMRHSSTAVISAWQALTSISQRLRQAPTRRFNGHSLT